MLGMPYERIVEALKEKTSLSEEEIKDRVDKKLKSLSGLISKEGAAHIVANELGVKLFEVSSTGGRLQIKNILSGMRSVEALGRVVQVYEVNEFQRESGPGKVGSLIMGDETGTVRIVFWNDMASKIANIKVGDIIRIKGGYVRDRNGRLEVHLNDRSVVIMNPPGETVAELKAPESVRKSLKDLTENDANVEILGTIVQVFNPTFFEVCPECKKRVRQKESGYVCEAHGAVAPAYSYVMNAVFDDGTENIRAVFFRNQAERLLNRSAEQMLAFRSSPDTFESLKTEVQGSVVKLQGRVTKNAMFDRLEFVANSVVTDVDPEAELKRLESKGI